MERLNWQNKHRIEDVEVLSKILFLSNKEKEAINRYRKIQVVGVALLPEPDGSK